MSGIVNHLGSKSRVVSSKIAIGSGTSGGKNPAAYHTAQELVITTIDEGGITLVAPSVATASGLFFADGIGAGAYAGKIMYDHNGNVMHFATATTTRMMIGAGGHIDAQNDFRDDQFDFAEFFEWVDGNPDDEYRAGETVILVGGKIRIATSEDDAEDIIGVITDTAGFTGNAASFGWHKRFVTDDFGKREWIEEDGERKEKINPDWDESQEYVERDKRKEWTKVGLLGQVAIKKTSPKRTSWIKLKDVTDTIEQWLVR